MAKSPRPDPKVEVLRRQGTFNPRSDQVSDALFVNAGFFDARDLVQVKYEMVRRVQVDGQAVSHSAAAFGFSRPSFYLAQAALARGGLAALVPKKPGPRSSHKLSTEVMEFVLQQLSEDASLGSTELARKILTRFGSKIHPRSIERALARREKKLR